MLSERIGKKLRLAVIIGAIGGLVALAIGGVDGSSENFSGSINIINAAIAQEPAPDPGTPQPEDPPAPEPAPQPEEHQPEPPAPDEAPTEIPDLEAPPQPEPLTREMLMDEEFPPDTVLAKVLDTEIAVADVHDFILSLAPMRQQGLEYRQHEVLDELIAREALAKEAEELNIAETEEYEAVLEMMEGQPDAETEAKLNALLQIEVIEGIVITDDELRDIYEENREMIPAEVAYEQIENELRQVAMYQRIESYISNLVDDADVEKNEAWIEAQEVAHQQMLEDMRERIEEQPDIPDPPQPEEREPTPQPEPEPEPEIPARE